MAKKRLMLVLLCLLLPGVATAADPTRPKIKQPEISQAKSTNKEQVLTGILKKGKVYTAIIDGQLYRVGDDYHGNRILSISSRRVKLRGQSGTWYLTLFNQLKHP